MAKSSKVAYVLWFLGGGWGLHHFYLHRDRQAFLWWATWGGLLGIGCMRDLYRIPAYVKEANNDTEFVAESKSQRRKHSRPPWTTARLAGELAFGMILAYVAQYAIPDVLLERPGMMKYFLQIFGYLGAAIGVHIVANIGQEQCSFKYPLIGALVTSPGVINNTGALSLTALVATIVTVWKGAQWRKVSPQPPKRRHFCIRLSILTTCGFIYLTLWSSMILFNASITTKEGDEVRIHVALLNFLNSPAWLETKLLFKQLFDTIENVGWQKFIEQFIESLDPQGESNALKVLGLDSGASQEDIKAAYKKLARQFHPDRVKVEEEKEEAKNKFIEIQAAYEKLSDIRSKRSARQTKSRSD